LLVEDLRKLPQSESFIAIPGNQYIELQFLETVTRECLKIPKSCILLVKNKTECAGWLYPNVMK
jgi:hypothetical protein